MSVQFGRWNFDGQAPQPEDLAKVRAALAPYGPDGQYEHAEPGIQMVYFSLHTTKESFQETQPYVSDSGTVFSWDGRLDNREELLRELRDTVPHGAADVSVAAAAYDRWGIHAFRRLVGDWAISVWAPQKHTLLLAKDFLGSRHLYYMLDGKQVTWCTVLDPLVLFSTRSFELEGEYIAGWLSFFPAADLTPYAGIRAVPPASLIIVRSGTTTVQKYWDFDPDKTVRHRVDAEYEEHFRTLFSEAVRRRLRSDRPILAELSGGVDSSSIVCMADTVVARGACEALRLDTISYYNDSEPNWNERPYFTKVEEKRGRIGCHIDASRRDFFPLDLEVGWFAATPAIGAGTPNEASRSFATCLELQGNRVVLSGIGGDEVTGGVPTPVPELADLLTRARLRTLASQMKAWALDKKKPCLHLLGEVLREFLPVPLAGVPQHLQPAPWLHPSFVGRHHNVLTGYRTRAKLLGPLPSFQENVSTVDVLRRQLECSPLPLGPSYEKRYPYLDRDLLEFLFAVPREQLVRPGHRRSLLRRALAGIVPDEILNRKRKAFVARSPLMALASMSPRLMEISPHMVSVNLGIVDARAFSEAAESSRHDKEVPIVAMMRTLEIERWLRHLVDRNFLPLPNTSAATRSGRPDAATTLLRFS